MAAAMAATMEMRLFLTVILLLLAMIQIEAFASKKNLSSSVTQNLTLSVKMIRKCASSTRAIAVQVRNVSAVSDGDLLWVVEILLRRWSDATTRKVKGLAW